MYVCIYICVYACMHAFGVFICVCGCARMDMPQHEHEGAEDNLCELILSLHYVGSGD